MRILVAIPHYFHPQGRAGHGSLDTGRHQRARGLFACVTALHQFFGTQQGFLDIAHSITAAANQAVAADVDVVICTTRDRHLLSQLSRIAHLFNHRMTKAEPELLGFECHDVLREGIGTYDYCCYLEDDIIIHDTWLFHKLKWFSQSFGDDALLQANRYELDPCGALQKVYIDGDLQPRVTARYRSSASLPELSGTFFGVPLVFQQPLNPHSGCFFLSRSQMSLWASHPSSADRDISFVGPLESAATLSVLRTFRLFKPSAQNANFLEVHHFGTGFISLVGTRCPVQRPFGKLDDARA